MNTFHDYESLGFIRFDNRHPALCETFAGTEIVRWHGKIEGQLVGHIADAEKSRNFTYADKLREFLKIWRSNEITGSINRETLETLKAASDMLAVDSWTLGSYFRELSIHLKVLIASEEQLPRGTDMNQNEPFAGGGGGRGAPPMSPSFGPDGSPDGGEGMPGEGGPGGPGGAGEAEPPVPGAEGGPEGDMGASPDGADQPPGTEGEGMDAGAAPGTEPEGGDEGGAPEEELKRI